MQNRILKKISISYSKVFRLRNQLEIANSNGYKKIAERYESEIEKTLNQIDELNKLLFLNKEEN